MDDKYRGLPLPTSREAKERADKTLRNIYGTRVKIPPPGPEREELVCNLREKISRDGFPDPDPGNRFVEKFLRALEELEG